MNVVLHAQVALASIPQSLSQELGAQAPNPHPQAPPGSETLLTVLNWAMWIVLGAAVLGFIVAGGLMMLQHRHGQSGEHGSRLGMIAAGCIVAASASGLVNILI